MFPKDDPKYLLGGSLSVAFNGRREERIGPFIESKIRNEQEVYGAGGFRLVKDLFLVGTAGIASQSEKKDVIRAPGEPKGVIEVPLHNFLSASGQVRYVRKRIMVGLGYHSRRGVFAGLGFVF